MSRRFDSHTGRISASQLGETARRKRGTANSGESGYYDGGKGWIKYQEFQDEAIWAKSITSHDLGHHRGISSCLAFTNVKRNEWLTAEEEDFLPSHPLPRTQLNCPRMRLDAGGLEQIGD